MQPSSVGPYEPVQGRRDVGPRQDFGPPDEVIKPEEWLDPDVTLENYQPEEPKSQAAPPPDARPLARRGLKTHRTGPKGVVADYNEAKLKMRARRIREKIAFENKLSAQAVGAPAPLRPVPGEEKSDSEDDSDAEIIAQYKKDRIRMAHEELPSFGTLTELNADNFAEEIDGEPACVTIIIHVYQDYLEQCVRMNDSLTTVAAFYPLVKFMKGRTDHILPDYPDEACPTFIVFKGGSQIHNLVCVLAEIGYPFKDQAVVQYLKRFNLLPERAPTSVDQKRGLGGEEEGSDDDGTERKPRVEAGTTGNDSDSDLDL